MKIAIAITILTIAGLFLAMAVLDDVAAGLMGLSGLAVAAGGLILMIFNPLLGLVLIILVNQVDNMIPLPMSATAGRLLGIVVAVGWFLKYFYRKKTAFFALIDFNKLALLFIVAMMASSLLASHPAASFTNVVTIVFLILMVFFIQDFVEDREDLHILIVTIALSVGIGALFGILQYRELLGGNQVVGLVEYEGTERTARLAGLTENSNAYGVVIMSGIPFLLFLILNAPGRIIRWAAFCFFFAAVVSLGLTLSRTNILGFIIFMLIFIFYNFRYRSISKSRLISLCIILVLLGSLASVFLKDIIASRSFTFEDSSSELRTAMMLKGIALMAANPVFGIGFGNFELQDGLDEFGTITGRPGHDLISVGFASTGLLGTILFILICYRTLRYLGVAVRHYILLDDRYLTNFIITIKSAYIALLLTCLGNPIIFQRIFWIYTALAVVLHFWSRKHSMLCSAGDGSICPSAAVSFRSSAYE